MASNGGGQQLPPADPQAEPSAVEDQMYQNKKRLKANPPTVLPDLRDPLTGKANFETWQFQVYAKLKVLYAAPMIDITTPRPAKTSSYYELWEDWSIFISSWLIYQVSPEISERLRGEEAKNYYADETYDEIRKIVLGKGFNKHKVVFSKLYKMRRTQYPTIPQYISDFRQTYDLARRLHCGFQAYFAAMTLLINIRNDMPGWCDMIEQGLENFDNDNFTDMQFYELCVKASEKAETEAETGDVSASAMTSSLSTSQQGSQKPNNKRNNKPANVPKDHKRWPSKDVNKDEWVRQWLAFQPPQTNGLCSYCMQHSHDVFTCAYLVPAKRWKKWRPLSGIYAHQWGRQGNQTPTADPPTLPARPELPAQSNMAVHYEDAFQFSGMSVHATDLTMKSEWLWDTGASQHITPDRTHFIEYRDFFPNEKPYRYKTSHAGQGQATGVGIILIKLDAGNGQFTVIKDQAYYNPDMEFGILSQGRIEETQGYWLYPDRTIREIATQKIVAYFDMKYNVPFVRLFRDIQVQAATVKVDPYLLHRRLGHAGTPRLKATISSHEEIETEGSSNFDCDACLRAKSRRQVSRAPITTSTDPTDLWTADLQMIKPTGHGGFLYTLVMVNPATQRSEVRFLRTKSDATQNLINFNKEHKNVTGYYIRSWRVDGGTEFQGFKKWAEAEGIRVTVTPPHTPEANGPSERYGGYINQTARAMILDAGLPHELWPFAVDTANMIINRLSHANDSSGKSPVQKWREHYGVSNPKPPLDYLRVYGCRAYIHIPQADRVQSMKMADRANVGYLVGYEGDHGHIFKVWIPENNRVYRSRDVKFIESRTYKDDREEPGPAVPMGGVPRPNQPTGGGAYYYNSTARPDTLPATAPPPPELTRTPQAPVPPAAAPDPVTPTGPESPIRGRVQTLSPTLRTPAAPRGPRIQPHEATRLSTIQEYVGREEQSPTLIARPLIRQPDPQDLPMPGDLQDAMDIDGPEPMDIDSYESITTTPPGEPLEPTTAVVTTPAPGHRRYFPQAPRKQNNYQPPVLPGFNSLLHLIPDPVNRQERWNHLFGEQVTIPTSGGLAESRWNPTATGIEGTPTPIATTSEITRIPALSVPPAPPLMIQQAASTAPPEVPVVERRVSSRTSKGIPPKWYGDNQAYIAVEPGLRVTDITIPLSYKAAVKSSYAEQWRDAMAEEIKNLLHMKVYTVVPFPKNLQNIHVLPGKWVYALKEDADGYVTRFKARWVICGNRQRPGEDFDMTHAPVASESSVKMALTAIALRDLEWEQVDVVTAFLHSAIDDRKIYMRQPTGFEQNSDDVCLLQQALYGLRQAGHLWNKELDLRLQELGFRPIAEDPCIYLKESTIMIVYVDDFIIADQTTTHIDKICNKMAQYFRIKRLGAPARFLGSTLTRDRQAGTITLSQRSYTEDLLVSYQMDKASPQHMPMNPGYRSYRQEDLPADREDIERYARLLGRLNWLSIRTRPDITHAVFRLQRRSHAPSAFDVAAARNLLKYLTGHHYDLTLAQNREATLEVYLDAAFQDHADGKSTESYVIFYAGSPVSWSSKKQTIVASSSTLAEYIAFDKAIKEALWIKKLAQALGLKVPEAIPVFTDSANALTLIESPTFTPNNRWIDNRLLFVRDCYKKGLLKLIHISGTENPADGLTKPLDSTIHRNFCRMIRLTSPPVTAVIEQTLKV